MAAPMARDLASVVAQGDLEAVEQLLSRGADVHQRSKDGMTPLSVAAFWGYANIAKLLLKNGADVNAVNHGTNWTPLHCAAFQGHGPVVLRLLEYKPDITARDARGRLAADFASALDSIWPFFQAAGCKRTPKSQLIQMNIVHKVNYEDPTVCASDIAHFSRPGSAYAMRPQEPSRRMDPRMQAAAFTGDVLAAMPEEPDMTERTNKSSLIIWEN